MASPKPMPPALRLVGGRSAGRDSGGRVVAPTPKYVRLPPTAPDWLPKDAAEEWERVVPELARLELTKPVDAAALTAYCLTWQRMVDAQRLAKAHRTVTVQQPDGSTKRVNTYGLLSENSQGIVRAPWVAIAEAASKELRAWCAEFGFTPSAENKLSAPEVDDGDTEDPFA